MAKIASSKPYGSGKVKTPTKSSENKKEIEVVSPIRTSPRRRKSEAAETGEQEKGTEKIEVKKTGGRGEKPKPPTFSGSKKKIIEAKPKSPKTPGRGRRKSVLEPVVLTSAIKSEPAGEAEGTSEETSADEIDNIFKYISQTSATEEEFYDDDDDDDDEEEEEEDYVGSIHRREREELNLILERQEMEDDEDGNSPIFDEEEEVNHEVPNENLEEFEHVTTPSDEEVAFHFDEDEIESSEGSNSEALNEEEYNAQFRYNSSNVRLRLAQYFQRQESALSSASSLKNRLWTRMKEWVSTSVISSAKELGEVTVEYTKKAIEQITKRLEKKDGPGELNDNDVSVYEDEPIIYEITEEEQEEEEVLGTYDEMDFGQGGHVNVDGHEECDNKRIKLMENEEDLEMLHSPFVLNSPVHKQSQSSSLKSSYHSVPADETLMFTPQKQENPQKPVYSEVMDSRLTEIVLFFAKCTRDTPIASIYEHLEEFFTLKGDNTLNLTEKQLVSSVIKDFLTEKDEAVKVPTVPAYEPAVKLNESPKRIKVLSGSGIRFRAPKFTAEEEARLEELEQARRKNLTAFVSNNKISVLSTPQQRSKIQRKLLTPEATAEFIEGMPENRGKASNTKNEADSVSSAIEEIICQKIKEAKQREEAERLETEKLKARVAELERESRERATKEALLQKQLEEQKKELEIEKAAAKEKLESLKAAASLKEIKTNFSFGKVENKETSTVPVVTPTGSVGFNFGKIENEKPPGGFSFGETSKSTAETSKFNGFSFAGKSEESKKEETKPAAPFASFNFGAAKIEEAKSEDSKAAAPFASFSFGKKETVDSGEQLTKLNPNAPAFNFGSAKTESEVKSDLKPKASFGFSFGNSSITASEEKTTDEKKPTVSFGASKTDSTAVATEEKGGFSFGSTAAVVDSKPANGFNFGSLNASDKDKQESTNTFSFGSGAASTTGKPAPTPTFNFGSSGTEAAKKEAAIFNFGAKPPVSSDKPAFSFGTSEAAKTSDPVKSNAFKTAEPTKTSTGTFGSFNFNASAPANNANNPFAALNSATNIFSSSPSLNSNNFSFGAPAAFPPAPSANAFSFPPISPSNTGAPIIPMNFGSSTTQPGSTDQQSAEMAFQPGSRTISIPKRRRK